MRRLKTALFACLVVLFVAATVWAYGGKQGEIGLPPGFSFIPTETLSGPHDEYSGTVLFAKAKNDKGASIEISYNSGVPLKNSEMTRYAEFIKSQKFKSFEYTNIRLIQNGSVNWISSELQPLSEHWENAVILLHVSFDGSPQVITFKGPVKEDLIRFAEEFISLNSHNYEGQEEVNA